ncbi:ETC complex I subunit conserved region-domain-containing protein [Bisporella sp. PMI_857]|nr:ETC complex I subunit conserved region-domain-containing protein [Bisporella sp. PMI_857]
MSLLRPSIAGRLLRAGVSNTPRVAPSAVRWESVKTDPIDTPLAKVEEVPQAPDAVRSAPFKYNQPNYLTEADQATSLFSPVPKRVMNGSEDTDVLPAAVLSGAPTELEARNVRIYRPAKTATQSGDWHGHHWRMDWDILSKGHRWENPLMGWQSSADFMQGTHLNFKSKEDAIAFAEKQGYEYFVQEPNTRKFTPKAYANNFLYSDKKLKHIRTK